MDATRRSDLAAALARHGLRLRGGWVPGPGDALPPLPAGAPPAVVWMVGQVGAEPWPHFAASPFAADGQPDPLDRWAQAVAQPLAEALRGVAVFPSDGPPWPPFQQWARRAEPVAPSPLGLLIHPQWGLWHAYRFALVSPTLHLQDARALVPAQDARAADAPAAAGATGAQPAAAGGLADLCTACSGQPCLQACPVQAFRIGHYDLAACAGHLHGAEGGACLGRGCLARRACPVGAAHRYEDAQAAFHMRAFAQRH